MIPRKIKKSFLLLLFAISSAAALVAQSRDEADASSMSPLMMFRVGEQKPTPSADRNDPHDASDQDSDVDDVEQPQRSNFFPRISESENSDGASTESDDTNGALMELTTSASSAGLAARSSSAASEQKKPIASKTGRSNEHAVADVTGTSSKTSAVADKAARFAKYQAALQRSAEEFVEKNYGSPAQIKKGIEDQKLADQVATERAYREIHKLTSMQPHWKVTAPTQPIPDVLTDEDLDNPQGINIPGIPERLVRAWVETRHDDDRTQADDIFDKIFSVAKRNHEGSLNPIGIEGLRKNLEKRLNEIAQEENQKVPYDRNAYFATHSIAVENNHGIKAAASSAVSASSAVGAMDGHEIEVMPDAQPQYMRIVEARTERLVNALKEHAEETARQLSMFRTNDPGIDGSKRLALNDEGTLFVQPAAATTDQEKAANRKVAAHFFEKCINFYGETLLNDIYPAAEREKLLSKGEPLTVATVRSILTKADKVVSEVVAYLKELPHLDLNVAEHVVLSKQAQEESDKALAAYQEIGEPAQHLVSAIGHSMTAVNATIFAWIIPGSITGAPAFYIAGSMFMTLETLQEKTLVSLLSHDLRAAREASTSPMFRCHVGAFFGLTATAAGVCTLMGVPALLGVAYSIISYAGYYAGRIASHASAWGDEAASRYSTTTQAKESARPTLIAAQEKAAAAHTRALATTQQAAQQAVDDAYEMPEEELQRDPESGVLSFTPATRASIDTMHDNVVALDDARLAAQENAKQTKIKKSKSVMPAPPWKRGAGI